MPPFIFIRFVGSDEVFAHISDAVFKFNQKNASTSASHAWTTRFTVSAVFSFGLAKHFNSSSYQISSERGRKTSPEHSRQPNGDPIPWGLGRLATADDKLTNAHGGSAHLSSVAPATSRMAFSTSHHLKASEAKTATPPEVTLNVPAPKSTRKSRRDALQRSYVSSTHADKFPLRCDSTITQSGCKMRLRKVSPDLTTKSRG